jgi:hypothetical protein
MCINEQDAVSCDVRYKKVTISQSTQTDPGAHPPSYSMSTVWGPFTIGKAAKA